MAAELLAAQGVRFSRGARRILDGVDLSVRAGELLAVLGPSGAGKSTLLRLLGGLLPPQAGAVTLDGRALELLAPRERAQHIALVPQEAPPEEGLTALEAVLLGRAPHLGAWGIEGHADRALALEALAELGMADHAPRLLSTLSGGERRRVLLARARAQAPRVLLLDEPTAHLDLASSALLLDRARAWASSGVAVVAVLHDPNLARSHAERVAVCAPSGKVEAGPVEAMVTPERLSALYGWPVEEALQLRAAAPRL